MDIKIVNNFCGDHRQFLVVRCGVNWPGWLGGFVSKDAPLGRRAQSLSLSGYFVDKIVTSPLPSLPERAFRCGPL